MKKYLTFFGLVLIVYFYGFIPLVIRKLVLAVSAATKFETRLHHPTVSGWVASAPATPGSNLGRFLAISQFLNHSRYKDAPAQPMHWMDKVVAKEFKKFEKSGISKELLEATWLNCQRIKEFQRYKIIDSKVYGPATRVKSFLEVLVQKYPVPDVDFIYFYEDRIKKSFFSRSKHKKSAPLFVSAKEKGMDSVVLFCDWNYDITDHQGGWNGLIEKVDQNKAAWSTKIDKLFWRGMPWDGKHFGMYDFDNWTSIPRGHLVHQSHKFPEWIDAAFSEYPARMFKKDPERCCLELGKIDFVSWPDVFRYKYQIALDGVTSSFPATQWKLLSGCLVFKQETENMQYFYGELIPWKHYIPLKKDLSDLMEKLEWAKKNDLEAQQIAANAREFVLENLMPEHILLYCYKVLVKYAALQRFIPRVTEESGDGKEAALNLRKAADAESRPKE